MAKRNEIIVKEKISAQISVPEKVIVEFGGLSGLKSQEAIALFLRNRVLNAYNIKSVNGEKVSTKDIFFNKLAGKIRLPKPDATKDGLIKETPVNYINRIKESVNVQIQNTIFVSERMADFNNI